VAPFARKQSRRLGDEPVQTLAVIKTISTDSSTLSV
jgi:hypothetical protein